MGEVKGIFVDVCGCVCVGVVLSRERENQKGGGEEGG